MVCISNKRWKVETLRQTVIQKTVVAYEDVNGHEPYTEWLNEWQDTQGKARIRIQLRRLAAGLYGDCEPVGAGVKELRMFFGPGYRVYFGEEANDIVVLLVGGDKSTQKQDIKTAKAYWKEYQNHGKT